MPSAGDGHLGCFPFLAVMNNAALKRVDIRYMNCIHQSWEIKTKQNKMVVFTDTSRDVKRIKKGRNMPTKVRITINCSGGREAFWVFPYPDSLPGVQ